MLKNLAVKANVLLRNGKIVQVTKMERSRFFAGGREYYLDGRYIVGRSKDPAVACYAQQFDAVEILLAKKPSAPPPLVRFYDQRYVPNKPKIDTHVRSLPIHHTVFLKSKPVGLIYKSIGGIWYYMEDLTGTLPPALPRHSSYDYMVTVCSAETEQGIKQKIRNRLTKIFNNLER